VAKAERVAAAVPVVVFVAAAVRVVRRVGSGEREARADSVLVRVELADFVGTAATAASSRGKAG
jgi:hypothetical protein